MEGKYSIGDARPLIEPIFVVLDTRVFVSLNICVFVNTAKDHSQVQLRWTVNRVVFGQTHESFILT